MMKKVDRGMKLLERLKAKTGMTEDGMNWLIAVLDPSHDEKLACRGYPDRNVGPSVLQVIKEEYSIVQPAFTTPGGVWGFHMWLDDYICNDISSQSASNVVENQNISANQVVAPGRQYITGGLNAVAFNESIIGTADVTTTPPIATGNQNRCLLGLGAGSTRQTTLDNSFLQGKVRKIAESFEICNTTAELYRGGSILAYEQPTSKMDPTAYYVKVINATLDPETIAKYGAENIFIEPPRLIEKLEEKEEVECDRTLVSQTKKLKEEDQYTKQRYYVLQKGEKVYLDKYLVDVNRNTVQTITVDNLVPLSLKEAMILPGTQQWGAEEGCYCVQSMDSMDNSPSFCTTAGSVYTPAELTWPVAGVTNDYSVTPFVPSYGVDVTSGFVTSTNNFKTPFNKKGVILSGLTPQSTFKVNRTIVIERFISSQDGSLATLSNMSPAEDYVALAFYSEVVKHLPIASRFKDNGLGDWFLGIADSIASTVGDFARPIMGAAQGWMDSRAGGAPVQGAPRLAKKAGVRPNGKVKPIVKMQAGKVKKKGIVEGPRMPTGSFNSPNAKIVSRGNKIAKGR